MPPDENFALIRHCARATGLTPNEVVRIAGIGPMRYKVYQIPKRSGGQRIICHPSRELKALQYVFLREILAGLPVHEAATAYKAGSSIKANASAHKASRVILKLDFEGFFPAIKASAWEAYARDMLPNWSDGDISFSQYVMFWGAGTYRPVCLSIGAPTSPLISNAIMYQFDGVISNYAAGSGLVYTRYADDITISSEEFLDCDAVLLEIKAALATIPYPKLKLNAAKTKIASKSTSRRITGLVISNDSRVSLGRDRKRLIRSMVHHALTGQASPERMANLAGLLSFASDVEPSFIDTLAKKFGADAIDNLRVPKAGSS